MAEISDRWVDLGAFIRDHRAAARLSLRQLSALSGISNPYLSQIERGLRRPSAEILQQIAGALGVSAESLYIRAGILKERPPGTGLLDAIWTEPTLSDRQKAAVVDLLASFGWDAVRADRSPETDR